MELTAPAAAILPRKPYWRECEVRILENLPGSELEPKGPVSPRRKSWSACYKIVLQQFLCVPVVFFSVVFFHHNRNTEHVYTDKATKLHHNSMPTMYLLCCLFLPGHQNAMWVICVVSSLTRGNTVSFAELSWRHLELPASLETVPELNPELTAGS